MALLHYNISIYSSFINVLERLKTERRRLRKDVKGLRHLTCAFKSNVCIQSKDNFKVKHLKYTRIRCVLYTHLSVWKREPVKVVIMIELFVMIILDRKAGVIRDEREQSLSLSD